MRHALTFEINHLLYDIGNYAYVVGHKIETETGDTAAAHLVTDICAEGNIDRVKRVLGDAHALVLEMLRPYTSVRAQRPHILDNMLREPTEYQIHIQSEQMSLTTLHLLAHAIHEYMVCFVLYDWLSIVYAPAAPIWGENRANAAAEINQCLRSSTGGILRRHCMPF